MKKKDKTQKRSEAQLRAIRRSYAIRANKAKKEVEKKAKKERSKENCKSKNSTSAKYPIRYYKGSRHHHVIVKEINNKNLSIGITHDDKSGHHKNIKLNKNPNPNDDSDSHLLFYPQIDYKKYYGKIENDFKIDESDYPKVEKIAQKKPQDITLKEKSSSKKAKKNKQRCQ